MKVANYIITKQSCSFRVARPSWSLFPLWCDTLLSLHLVTSRLHAGNKKRSLLLSAFSSCPCIVIGKGKQCFDRSSKKTRTIDDFVSFLFLSLLFSSVRFYIWTLILLHDIHFTARASWKNCDIRTSIIMIFTQLRPKILSIIIKLSQHHLPPSPSFSLFFSFTHYFSHILLHLLSRRSQIGFNDDSRIILGKYEIYF